MAKLPTRIGMIFRRAWEAYGNPTAAVVKPVAEWNLPAGFSYDARLDRITDAAHQVLPNPEAYWVEETVYIVPATNPDEMATLIAAGLVKPGSMDIGVLSADAAKLENAYAVRIDSVWYVVDGVETGFSAGWRRVRLARRL